MSNRMRLLLLLALLLPSLLGAGPTASAVHAAPSATAAPDADCPVLPQGVYQGGWEARLAGQRPDATGLITARVSITDTATFNLTVNCAGEVTAGTMHWDVHRYLWILGLTPLDCMWSVDFSGAKGLAYGADGQSRIDVRWDESTIHRITCSNDGKPWPVGTWRFSLAGPIQGRTIGGDFRTLYDDPNQSDYDQIAETFRSTGYEIAMTKGWKAVRLPRPSVVGLSANLRQYFLAGIPLTIRYTAAIDWDTAPPGQARFIVGDNPPAAMTVTGDTAVYDLPVATLKGAGKLPISIEAESNGFASRTDGLGPLTLVPVPAWAVPFHLQAQVQGDSVRYTGENLVPSTPLEAEVPVPTNMPLIGGAWRMLPTQLQLGLAANSQGTLEMVAGRTIVGGGYGLGEHTLAADVPAPYYPVATLSDAGLTPGGSSFRLHSQPFPFTYRPTLSLLSVVEDLDKLIATPVIGNLVLALDEVLASSSPVSASMITDGLIGLSDDTFGVIASDYRGSAEMSAAASTSLPGGAWATFRGDGGGKVSQVMLPAPGRPQCGLYQVVNIDFGGLGYRMPAAVAMIMVPDCANPTVAANLGRAVYGSPGSASVERSVLEPRRTAGLDELVLAEGLSQQAQPGLAAGPGGRMALVWNSVSASEAADAVSLRLFDGTAWSSPITVSQPGRPAFAPAVAFDGAGQVLVAWAEAQAAPDPAGLTAAFARSLEVAWARVDPGTRAVTARGLVTNDQEMDYAPRLTATPGGALWLAWVQSPGADMVGTAAAPNRLLAARWTGSGWSAAETAGANLAGTLSWDAAALDDKGLWLAAQVDTDGNLASAGDREIYLYRRSAAGWAAPLRLTNDTVLDDGPLLAVTSSGQPALAWRHGDTVSGLIGDPAATATWLAPQAGVGPGLANGRLVAGPDGALTLIWPDGTEHGQDLWLARYRPSTHDWTIPAPVFNRAEQRRSPAAVTQANGDIVVALAAAASSVEPVTLPNGDKTTIPAVSDAAQLLLARIPATFVPTLQNERLFLPAVRR